MNYNRNYIFINQVTGPLFIDIVNIFVEKGHNVLLYTGQVEAISNKLDKRIRLRKLSPYHRKTTLLRISTWLLFFFQSFFCLLFDKKRETRLFLVSNPPLCPFLNLFFHLKSDILIYDIYPDALKSLSFITEKSLTYRLFSYFNRKAFSKSDHIYTISELMKDSLKQYTTDTEKIKVVPCWANTHYIKPVPKSENDFINKHCLEDKFIIMYSGNLGLSHDIETILKSAESMQAQTEIMFVIIGDGAKKKLVYETVENKMLKNILVLPLQQPEMLKHSMTAADIAIVTLDSCGASYAVPSKTYYFMAAGVAIIAIADSNSELSGIIDQYHVGKIVNPKNPELLRDAILYYFNNWNDLSKIKKNSRKASLSFTSKNAEAFLPV